MKLQTRNVTAKRAARRGGKGNGSLSFKLYVLLYLLVVIIVIFGVFNYSIDLNRKIDKLQREESRAKQEIFELERDIQALKVTRQQLTSWNHVNRKISAYQLPLRPADPQQVRYLAVKQVRKNVPLSAHARHDDLHGQFDSGL